MTVSERGLEFIAAQEGWRGRVYADAVGVPTIGYGHVLHGPPITWRDRALYWSRKYALKRLRSDVARYESYVRSYVTVPLNQHQYDSLVSFCFNLGPGALSQLVHNSGLNKGAYKPVADQIPHYDHAGGVVLEGLRRRRLAEAAMFLHGTYQV